MDIEEIVEDINSLSKEFKGKLDKILTLSHNAQLYKQLYNDCKELNDNLNIQISKQQHFIHGLGYKECECNQVECNKCNNTGYVKS
jgi:hypothetical protein